MPRVYTRKKTKQYSAGDVERAYAAWRGGEHCNKKIKPLHCNKKKKKTLNPFTVIKKTSNPFTAIKKNIKPLHCN